jgi:hypothetical protein
MTTKPHAGRLITAGAAYRDYCITIEAGVTLESLLKPEMWRLNTSGVIRPNDTVRCIAEDGSFDCVLTCTGVLPGAGLLMQLNTSAIPGSAEHDRLAAIAAEVHAEEEGARRAKLEAATRGGDRL